MISAINIKAEQITIAVASNFSSAMSEIINEFEKQTPHKIRIVYGSSGKIYAQISNGAPFQLFLSADRAKAIALEKSKLIVPNSRFTYAIGTLALWSPSLNVAELKSQILKQGQFNKLALANPKLAPYGTAALEALNALELADQTRDKWVRGENIAQTFQFVSTANADIGFVALSQIMSNHKINKGSAWIVPEKLYSPIRQDAVLLLAGKNSSAALALLQFIQSDTAKSIISSYGYKTP